MTGEQPGCPGGCPRCKRKVKHRPPFSRVPTNAKGHPWKRDWLSAPASAAGQPEVKCWHAGKTCGEWHRYFGRACNCPCKPCLLDRRRK